MSDNINEAKDVNEVVEETAEEIVEKKEYDGIKFSVKIDGDDMVNFILKHSYSNISGWLGVAISLFAIVYLVLSYKQNDMSMNIALIFIGCLFTIVNPIMLTYKAKKQVKTNPTFEIPIDYTLADEALVIEQKEDQVVLPWNEIRIVKDFGRSLIVYVSKVRAFIMPKNQIGDQYEAVTKLMTEKMTSARVRLKK